MSIPDFVKDSIPVDIQNKKIKKQIVSEEKKRPPSFLKYPGAFVAGMGQGFAKIPKAYTSIPLAIAGLGQKAIGKEPTALNYLKDLSENYQKAIEDPLERRFEEKLGALNPLQEKLMGAGEKAASLMGFLVNPQKALVGGLVGETAGSLVPEKYKTMAETAAELPFMMERPQKTLESVIPAKQKEFFKLAKKYNLNEKEITPLIQGEGKQTILKWLTSGGKKLQETTENIGAKLLEAKDKVLGSVFKGYKKGSLQEVQKYADTQYGNMVKELAKYKKVKINPRGLRQVIAKARNKLRKQAGKSSQEETALNYLEKLHGELSSRKFSADELADIYRSINRSRLKGEIHLEDALFVPIQKNIRNQIGKVKVANREIGKKMLKQFDETNLLYKKAAEYETIHKKLSTVFTDEGANFTKMDKMLSQPVNKELFENVLGKEAVQNLKEIGQIGRKSQEVLNFFQKNSKFVNQHDLKAVATLLALKFGGAVKTIATLGTSNWIGKQLLMNPKYQNLWKRMAEAANNGKWNIAKNLAEKIYREADKEYKEKD